MLVLCHGENSSIELGEIDFVAFDSIVNINARSYFHLVSMAAPFMKFTKGSMVLVSSYEADIVIENSFLNGVSKSLVSSLTKQAALELAPAGVRVNAVAPAITDTNFRMKDFKDERTYKEFLSMFGQYYPLTGNIVKAQAVADSILFLLSKSASFITGEIIAIDNGFSLYHDSESFMFSD